MPSNIGKGSRRKKRKAFLNHLDIALGSQAEVEVQLEIAQRLQFLKMAEYKTTQMAVEEIGRMLNGPVISLDPRPRRRTVNSQLPTTTNYLTS